MTISQGIAKVVFSYYDSNKKEWVNLKTYWVRLSRQKSTSILSYWSNQPNFRYMKIYEFFGSKKPKFHPDRITGRQIAYIYKDKNDIWQFVET